MALELYLRVGATIGVSHSEVVNLSKTLRGLPLHTEVRRSAKYRSPNSVHLKLQNFLAIDPAYSGRGLSHSGRGERQVWEAFAEDQPGLLHLVRTIREEALILDDAPAYTEEGEEVFPEGRILYRAHRTRERNASLLKKAKAVWIRSDDGLRCRVCGFDFQVAYGDLGSGYVECHHDVPVSELRPGSRTRISDLTPVCANCHRMLHRRRPWASVAELRDNVCRRATEGGR